MIKKLSYRNSSKGIAEQYGISLSKKMLNEMCLVYNKIPRSCNINFQ